MFGMSNEDLEEIIGICLENFETFRSGRYIDCAAVYAIHPENKTNMISHFMSEDSCIGSIYKWFMDTCTEYKQKFLDRIIITLFFTKHNKRLDIKIFGDIEDIYA